MTVLAVLLILSGLGPPQTSPLSIRGVVVNAATNAPIADARVTLIEATQSVLTGPDGRFAFDHLQARSYTLTVSTIGFIFVRRKIDAHPSLSLELSIPLAEGTGTYQEAVTVSGDASSRPRPIGVTSQMELGSAGLAELRGVAADDPMRAVQALPGVATGDDFQAEFSVRGSAFRHVGVVMDGTPTALLMHTIRSANDAGSIAMINSDILGRASLFSGPHARPHGDWLGSTLEFDVREGSRDRAGMRAAVSGTSASGVFEGPLGNARRGSWLFSIRRSYIDWLVRKLEPDVDSTIGFSDAQAKLVYDFSNRQQIQLFAIGGDTTYREQNPPLANGIESARSRSGLASLAWRYAHPRGVLTQRLSLVRSSYENRGRVGQPLADGWSRATYWRADFTAPLAGGWTLEAGARREWLRAGEHLRNFAAAGASTVRLRFERMTTADPAGMGAWLQAGRRGTRGGILAGVRIADRTDHQAQFMPWLLAEWTVRNTTLRGSYGRAAQFIDPLITPVAPAPRTPERAAGYDVSIERPLGSGWSTQASLFRRSEKNVLRRIGEDRLLNEAGSVGVAGPFPAFANELDGTARGLDLLLIRRAQEGLTGWIGYTWSHTVYTDRGSGESFDGDFDQRHTLNVFVQQRLSYRLAASAKLRLGSNFPIVGYFSGTAENLRLGQERNQVRLPFYARLDFRLNRSFTFERSRLTLFVEVMNVLGRRNGGQSDGFIRSSTLEAVGFVERLLPRVPSAGFLIEF